MKDKTFLREQILGHLKLYSDLGVRYVASPQAQARPAVRKSEKRSSEAPPIPRTGAPSAAPRIRVNTSMFDEAPSGEESLDAIQAELKECRRCKLAPGRTNLVFGSGNPHADLMFVGEAPGADEDAQGLPFVGRAGQLLTKIIEAIGMRRDEVYICNILKCRPPGNRNPETDEIASCEQYSVPSDCCGETEGDLRAGSFRSPDASQDDRNDRPASGTAGRLPGIEVDGDVSSGLPAEKPERKAQGVGGYADCPRLSAFHAQS